MSLPTLDQALQKLFGTTDITQMYGVPEAVGSGTEQGLDLGLSAGTPVRLAAPGALVYSNGYQDVFTAPGGLFQSYKHITANNNIPKGVTIAAGSIVGTISNLFTGPGASGPPPAGYASNGPHLEFDITQTAAAAESGTGGINPVGALETFAAQSWFRDTSSDTTPVIDNNDQALNIQYPKGTNVPLLGASPGQIGDALTSGAGTVAGDAASSVLGFSLAGKPVRTWVTLAVIIVAALLVFNALLRGQPNAATN